MRAVLQRVSRATVTVEGREISRIGNGVLVLLGVAGTDTDAAAQALARKVTGLRIFDDAQGKMNLSNEQVGGEFLVISQFTLLADLGKGKRPGFEAAMKPPEARRLYELFCEHLAALSGRPVRRGEFGAFMDVELVNHGPATFLLDA